MTAVSRRSFVSSLAGAIALPGLLGGCAGLTERVRDWSHLDDAAQRPPDEPGRLRTVPAKRLVVCCDGTWNYPQQKDEQDEAPTNVARLFAMLRYGPAASSTGAFQLAYYEPGVGAAPWERLNGGAIAQGIDRLTIRAYEWLMNVHAEGDEIFLFGFSRGAYNVRCLAGMLDRFGLLATERFPAGWSRRASIRELLVAYAYGGRYQGELPDLTGARRPRIRMIGVWDTVSAVGFADTVSKIARVYAPHLTSWLELPPPQVMGIGYTPVPDLTLGEFPGIVDEAYQALAIDDLRVTYAPVLWKNHRNRQQVWFTGRHSNVGGGYRDQRLAELALKWMVAKARGNGLEFTAEPPATSGLGALGRLDVGYWSTGGFKLTPRTIADSAEAAARCDGDGGDRPWIHASVVDRIGQDAEYAPPNLCLAASPARQLLAARYRIAVDEPGLFR